MTEKAPLCDRINTEPPILGGLNQSEFVLAWGGSCLVFFVIGVGLSFFTSTWWIFIFSTMFGPIPCVFMLSKHMATIKCNKPEGYYMQWLHVRMIKFGFKPKFIRHDGYWQIGKGFD
jgi:conjugative transfer region protein (TIGR03750 family)